ELLIGRRLDTGGGRELAAPHRDLFRDVAHVASLPCAEMSLTTDELIDRGMATAVYAAEAPDRMAVISPYGERTFRELNERTNQLVRGLRALGAGTGDTIALVSRNRPEFVEVYEAVLRSGLRLTPINWHLTAEEIAYIVDDSESVVVIGDAGFADTLSSVAKLIAATPALLSVGGDIDGYAPY